MFNGLSSITYSFYGKNYNFCIVFQCKYNKIFLAGKIHLLTLMLIINDFSCNPKEVIVFHNQIFSKGKNLGGVK